MLKPSQSFLVHRIQSKEKFCTEKELFKEKRDQRIEQKTKKKKGFLTALAMVIKKELTKSIRKHTTDLKVHKKIVRAAIKQDLSQDLNPLDYAKMGCFRKQNKCNFLFKY